MSCLLNKTRSVISEPVQKIPVEVEIPWQPPFEAYLKTRGFKSVLLESISGTRRIAKYSIIGLDPWLTMSAKGREITIAGNHGHRTFDGDPFSALRELCAGVPAQEGKTGFSGGAVGYFGYDAGRHIEKLPELAQDDLGLPDAVFFLCRHYLLFDHWDRRAKIISMVDNAADPEAAARRGLARVDQIANRLSGPVPARDLSGPCELKWRSNFTKSGFCDIVERAKEYIRAGDIYQVNLSQRLCAETGAPPIEIYRALREINPSPFAGFFDFGHWQLVGCSPERLIRLEKSAAETRPIAGTIRRGADKAEDGRLKVRLTSDIKERAEHVMLVDLERNDLGRVCEYGSIRADELLITESYSHVTHIVSNVVGRLCDTFDGFDLVRACFPGGTITGCPKVRAMEIIEELEPVRRGPYTGSLGYFGFNGDLDLNIIIRTLIMKDGMAYVQAGAGIVADSQPEREYLETLHKAEALLSAAARVGERRDCSPT